MSKQNFMDAFRRGSAAPAPAAASTPEETFVLKRDNTRGYTTDEMVSFARTGRITEYDFLSKFELTEKGSMADINAVMAAFDDPTSAPPAPPATPAPAPTPTPAPAPVASIPARTVFTDEDGNKIRAALFFDGKKLVTEEEAKKAVDEWGVDPAKFGWHKYSTKGAKIIPGTRLPGDLGKWDPPTK